MSVPENDWRTHPEGVAHLFYLDWVQMQKESEQAHTGDGVEPALHGENAPDSPDAT